MDGADVDEIRDLRLARDMARALLANVFEGENIESIRLEELRPKGYRTWEITFSFVRSADPIPTPNRFLELAAAAVAARPVRVFKVVTLDLGDPSSMSITDRSSD